MTTRQIIALGGGGFSMEASPLLDNYILAAASADRPRVCFLPTASGDSADYVARFYRAFSTRECHATHLELFRRDQRNLRNFLLSQDIIYVGGGNTANMIAIWRLHGLDEILREAWLGGVVLSGISAGSICWFEGGVSDSFGEDLSPLTGCLGFLPGSNCPHFDGEEQRRPRFHQLVENESLPPGVAADDGAALHYINDTLESVVSSRPTAAAYSITCREGVVVETPIETRFLG